MQWEQLLTDIPSLGNSSSTQSIPFCTYHAFLLPSRDNAIPFKSGTDNPNSSFQRGVYPAEDFTAQVHPPCSNRRTPRTFDPTLPENKDMQS
jgi:hypothetical protein